MFALSVSTSARTSPIATRSPGCFIQRRILPSSIVSESFGMVTSTAIVRSSPGAVEARSAGAGRDRRACAGRLDAEQTTDGGDHALGRRQDEVLEIARVG